MTTGAAELTRAYQGVAQALTLEKLVRSIGKKIDENQSHPEVVRVLKELGRDALADLNQLPLTPIPDWRPEFAEKFRE